MSGRLSQVSSISSPSSSCPLAPAGDPSFGRSNPGRPQVAVQVLYDDAITREVRDHYIVMHSTNAHNCKVVVNDGVVTLARPVANTDEKIKIETLATAVAGVTKVVNQLEIAP